jgi:filamentous hemagglutinin
VKTLDTNTLSKIANPETVRYTINGYINKMVDFAGDIRCGVPLNPETIAVKELHLAIPANTSPVHMRQIEHCIQYGRDNRVKVIVTKVR